MINAVPTTIHNSILAEIKKSNILLLTDLKAYQSIYIAKAYYALSRSRGGVGLIQFPVSVWDGGIFHCTNSWKRLKYTCLERG